MKIQLEHLDLLQPWPKLTLREGYYAIQVLVRMGSVPVGEVMVRPVRRRTVHPRRLRRRMVRKLSQALLRVLVREGLTAGADALKSPVGSQLTYLLAGNTGVKQRKFIETELLLETGLPAPYCQWVRRAQATVPYETPSVTVAVCTRNRPAQLEGCLERLKQLDYPDFEILVVDNSTDPTATVEVAERLGVSYTREPVAGLSRARNKALQAAQHDWVAFIDDDCRAERQWLRELVRPLQDTHCGCVCGLVLPAQLENSAEISFEIYGGLGRGFVNKVYDRGFLYVSKSKPAHTWRIGAGANMLIHRDLVRRLGGFDVDMGPAGVGGCGEDTLVYYQILRDWRTIHYTPRAIVHHYHRSSDAALRKHILSYATGHSAYHWHLLWRYGDYRSLLQLVWHLPRWFFRNFHRGIRGKSRYPFSLVFEEIKGTVAGPWQYSAVKLSKWTGALWDRWRRRNESRARTVPFPATVDGQATGDRKYVAVARQKPVRAA